MARINQTVPDGVVQYRKMLAVLRGEELQAIDAAVWAEYMTNHPLDNEPGYPKPSVANSGNETFRKDAPE